jgi:predicted site-specific integrase-resolvase
MRSGNQVKEIQKYNEKTAAKKLGVSERTLRRWRKSGVLPFIRAGAFVWYTDEILGAFLKQSTRNLAA